LSLPRSPKIESIVLDKREQNCSMTENISPNGVSFSDLICIFAMPVEDLLGFYCNTKLCESYDMAKS